MGPLNKIIILIYKQDFVKDLEFKLSLTDIHPNLEIKGTVLVSYPGRYDGVVVNTTILDSNEHIIYKSYNGKKISQNVTIKSLLSIFLFIKLNDPAVPSGFFSSIKTSFLFFISSFK